MERQKEERKRMKEEMEQGRKKKNERRNGTKEGRIKKIRETRKPTMHSY